MVQYKRYDIKDVLLGSFDEPEDAMIDIYGAITEEEGIRIAKGLSIQK